MILAVVFVVESFSISQSVSAYVVSDEKVINRSLTDYNYAIGRIVSFHLFDRWMQNDKEFIKDIPEITMHLHNLKIRDLVNKYGDLNVANEELAKTFTKRY